MLNFYSENAFKFNQRALNVDENSVLNGNHYVDSVRKYLKPDDKIILIAASIESEIIDLSTEDQLVFLKEMGLSESGILVE